MRQVVGFGDRSTDRGAFGGAFAARQCNQWGFYGVRVRHFRSADVSLESSIRGLFDDIVTFKIKVGVYEKLAKK